MYVSLMQAGLVERLLLSVAFRKTADAFVNKGIFALSTRTRLKARHAVIDKIDGRLQQLFSHVGQPTSLVLVEPTLCHIHSTLTVKSLRISC
jgi:hypothetical protein